MNISITALSGTLAGTKITQIINPAYKYQNIPGSRTDEADIWSSLQIDRVEQRTWCTKQKNTSVRQRQNMIGKKKQSWKEKKDQGREESPSYDQHVKPRKKMESSSENNHQSSSLVSQSSFEKHAQGAYSLIGSFQSPSTCRLKNGGISSIFTANEANDGSVILWEKQIPCSQPMQKVSLFCVQMAKTDVKMRNSLGQPRSFIMGHLIGQL